jgi:hypothetical protein
MKGINVLPSGFIRHIDQYNLMCCQNQVSGL